MKADPNVRRAKRIHSIARRIEVFLADVADAYSQTGTQFRRGIDGIDDQVAVLKDLADQLLEEAQQPPMIIEDWHL